jgi:hypothetical protein
MMVTGKLDHPETSLPVRRLHLLADCTTFFDNPTLASSPDQISSTIDVNNFQLFVDAINGELPDITDGNVADLSSLAIEFGFTRFVKQIKAHGHKFPVPRSPTWHGKDVHHLLANRPGIISPSRDQTITNLTCSVPELIGDGSSDVGQTSRFLMGHQQPMSPATRSETVQNSKIQAEIEALTTESQILKKENERLQTVVRTTVTENRKMKIVIKFF